MSFVVKTPDHPVAGGAGHTKQHMGMLENSCCQLGLSIVRGVILCSPRVLSYAASSDPLRRASRESYKQTPRTCSPATKPRTDPKCNSNSILIAAAETEGRWRSLHLRGAAQSSARGSNRLCLTVAVGLLGPLAEVCVVRAGQQAAPAAVARVEDVTHLPHHAGRRARTERPQEQQERHCTEQLR